MDNHIMEFETVDLLNTTIPLIVTCNKTVDFLIWEVQCQCYTDYDYCVDSCDKRCVVSPGCHGAFGERQDYYTCDPDQQFVWLLLYILTYGLASVGLAACISCIPVLITCCCCCCPCCPVQRAIKRRRKYQCQIQVQQQPVNMDNNNVLVLHIPPPTAPSAPPCPPVPSTNTQHQQHNRHRLSMPRPPSAPPPYPGKSMTRADGGWVNGMNMPGAVH